MQGFLGNKVLLAPMAGITDVAFRHLCIDHGATMCFTEMVSAKGLAFASQKTKHLLKLADNEKRVSVQLFGHEPNTISEEAKWIEDKLQNRLLSIDINMGCPARKIVKKGDGSALMKTPALAAEIISKVKASVSCPVTCKFRRGWSDIEGETAPEFALAMQEAGADAVTVHGRFATQMYQGKSEASCIKRVKDTLKIPVVGNGDIFCAHDAINLIEVSSCDAIMIARGALGNPWIFAEIQSTLESKGGFTPPSLEQRINTAIEHVKLSEHYKKADMDGALDTSSDDSVSLANMRKHAMYYVTGIPGAAKCRSNISKCSSLKDFEECLSALLN